MKCRTNNDMSSRENGGGLSRRQFLNAAGAASLGLVSAPFVLDRAAAAEDGITHIRYAHSAPLAHGWQFWGTEFKKAVEAKTDNNIQVKIFPNAQLGTEQDIARAIRLGSVEMGSVGVALMNWVPDFSVTDAPFLFKSRKQCYAALDGALGDELKKRALKGGFRIVGWDDLGSRSMTNSKHPINTVNDMHDLKMRVPNSKSYYAMMESFGASVVAVDLSELYLALSQGVADGQDTPPTVVQSNKYYEVQKFISKTDHVLTNSYSIMNPKFFDGLPNDKQDAVLAAGRDATLALRKHTINGENSAYSFLKSKGMTVNLEPDRESFRQACAGVITQFPKLFQPDLVALARSANA